MVESDGTRRDVTREMLERNGFDVLVAADGRRALELGRDHDGAIDLLLTDVVMPEMSGLELADAVKARHPETLVVYKTAYAKEVFGDGPRPVALMEKPFDEAQLLEVLGRHLPG